MNIHLICLQHIFRDAARHVGLSVTADPCSNSGALCTGMLYTNICSIPGKLKMLFNQLSFPTMIGWIAQKSLSA